MSLKLTKDEQEFLGKEVKVLKKVYEIIKRHKDGIPIQQIADTIGVSRVIVRGYVLLLIGKGLVKVRRVGVAKLLKTGG